MSGSGLLDPDTIKVMDEAFGLALRFLGSDPILAEMDQTVLRDTLARELLFSVQTGERNPRRLADAAIAVVRQAVRPSIVRAS
jgi:hypothetical protein